MREPLAEWEPALEFENRDRSTILIHYYRAMIGRADVWRMRMDATTNWAIGATAAVVSFTLGNAATPHYVVFIAVLLTVSFLFLEARRLTFYHLWQQRAQLIEKGLIRPALHAGTSSSESEAASDPHPGEGSFDLELALDPHLGRTIPSMPIAKAAARRLRRIYLYLFAVQGLAWLLKLSSTPTPVGSFAELVGRAGTGAIAGEIVVGLAAAGFLAAVAIAVVRGGVDHREPHRAEDAAG